MIGGLLGGEGLEKDEGGERERDWLDERLEQKH